MGTSQPEGWVGPHLHNTNRKVQLPYKMGNTFHHCTAMLGNHTFFLKIVYVTVLKGKMAQNQCRDFSE